MTSVNEITATSALERPLYLVVYALKVPSFFRKPVKLQSLNPRLHFLKPLNPKP